MKVLLDFLVLILFFAVYYITQDIFTATAAAMIGGVLQVVIEKLQGRKIDAIKKFSLLIILVFGGATLLFHDELWIKWKPTVLYFTFALILSVGLFMRKNFLQDFFGKEIKLSDSLWRCLTVAWSIFFVLLGALNLWVAFSFSIKQWVTFKVFGTSSLTLLFVVAQSVYVYRQLGKKKEVASNKSQV